jgi:tetratricopeptide (TPR) repeat protein
VAAPLEPETTPEEYRQRALLLADLGRYDEAAGEIAAGLQAAPEEPNLLATLARIHLVAEQPSEALRAADRANSAAPAILHTLVVRAMALTDSGRYGDAAQVAIDILRNWPADAYAQRTGAALLSEARNGQEALNAAWNGVRVAPAEAEAHLVLAVVAARLRLFDLAQRAYAEALDLDPVIGEAQRDVGIVRFERRRWAQALESLADQASLPAEPEPIEAESTDDMPYPEPFPRPYQAPDRPLPDEPPTRSAASWSEPPPVSVPAGPVLDPSAETIATVRQAVLYGAAWTLVAAVIAGAMTLASGGISRVWAALIGLLILGGVTFWLNRQLPEPLAAALARLRAHRRSLAWAAYLTFAAPILLLVYTFVGGVIPLAVGMLLAAAAGTVVLIARERTR